MVWRSSVLLAFAYAALPQIRVSPLLAQGGVGGSAIEQVIADPGVDIDPVLSPDGKSIVYASSRSGQLELWMRPLSGGGTYQLTTSINGSADRKPSFSPDGRYIAFTSDRIGDIRNIWLLELSTRSLAQLSTFDDDAAGPSFSPDGKEICFTRTPAEGKAKIWVMAADATYKRDIIEGIDCTFTPDGKSIVFSRSTGEDDALEGAFDLWVVNRDGTSPRALELSGQGWVRKPAVSIDGRWLAFTRYAESLGADIEAVVGGYRVRPGLTSSIWVIAFPVVGRAASLLTPPQSFNSYGSWGTDGSFYFTSTRAGSADIYRIRIARALTPK